MVILAWLIVLLMWLFAMYLIYLIIRVLFSPFEHRWFKKLLFYYFPRVLQPLSPAHKFINIYYKKLTYEERKRFEWRAFYFLTTTNVEFRNFKSLEIINPNSIRYLIASVATQMTLFLPEDCFDAFSKIIIYPDKYFSRVTQQFHNGETNPTAGHIILSYPAFRKGFETNVDGINLLMHELAHALWVEHAILDYQIFNSDALDHYKKIALREYELMLREENHFLRKYARTNQEEFFAVTVENFFERPAELKNALPSLYQAMAQLLNQDTLKLLS